MTKNEKLHRSRIDTSTRDKDFMCLRKWENFMLFYF